MNGLLKINVPQFIFLALSYIFAKNKCSFIYFSENSAKNKRSFKFI